MANVGTLQVGAPQDGNAVVDWGNGTTAPASLIPTGTGSYLVSSRTEYHLSGLYPVTVTLTRTDGVRSSFQTTAEVVPGPNQDYATQLYQNLLGRAPDAPGLGFWVTLLDGGTQRNQIVAGMETSPEYRTKEISNLYQNLLGRAPDAVGFGGFLQFLNHGGSLLGAEEIVLSSPEFFQHAGGDDVGFVHALYQDVTGHDADASGLAFWTSKLMLGVPQANVAGVVLTSQAGLGNLVAGYYQDWLQRPADSGGLSFFTNALETGARPEDLIAALLASDEFFKQASV
jgi:hypothetical protein